MSISFLENFASEKLVDKIEAEICAKEFAWHWSPSSRYGHTNPDHNSEDFQFTHTFFLNNKIVSNTFFTIRDLLFAFENHTGHTIKNIEKIKTNLLTRQPMSKEGLEETIHVDLYKSEKNYFTIVYYVTDSDGDTIIYDDDYNIVAQKSPKKGTAVCFPSYMLHRATPPITNKRRIVINIIVEI